MGSLAYGKLKQELFLAYEPQISALVEGSNADADEDSIHEGEDAAPAAATLPAHLQLSYAKQRLLCQRASRVAGRTLPLRSAAAESSPLPTQSPGDVDGEETSPTPTSATPVPLHSPSPGEAEENAVFVPESQPDWLRHRMLRVQAESIETLRREALHRAAREPPSEAPTQAEAEAATGPVAVWDILSRGGVSGEAFAAQRMALLQSIARDTEKKRVEQRAREGNYASL